MNDSNIDQMLRRKPPTIEVPASLETKIRARVRAEVAPSPTVRWQWIVLPAAAVLMLVALLRNEGDHPTPPELVQTTTPTELPTAEVTETVEDLPLVARNPLSSEARALRRDAERTGRFLINCLPSLTQAE
ncbi:hypothetical protein [Haloferula rosea]|uniref:Uncharacterized protein n=1 Tax=Haloferula rosea TaxID=490093 RepID=A0A934RFL2_9BACT|nr:hypothetical protein [Haloferula rosea]MBK1828612.1 hypothetical protein [Haloferula rosea]